LLSGTVLTSVIRNIPSRPKRDIFYRAMALRYSSDPLGKKRPVHAQRFNIANGTRVLYLSNNQVTCLAEVQAFGFPPSSVTIVPVAINLQAVLDLTDPQILATLQLATNELAFNFRVLGPTSPPAPTQELGECAAASGRIDGILFRSLGHPTGINLAVVESNLRRLGSSLSVSDQKNNLYDTLP